MERFRYPNKIFPVKDKYTYEKKHQIDYTQDENRFEESENRIQPRLMWRKGAELLPEAYPFTLCDCGIPKYSFAVRAFHEKVEGLTGCTGFAVEYECSSEYPVKAALRIILSNSDGDSFMSICTLKAGRHTELFEISHLTFAEDIRQLKTEVVCLDNMMHIKVEILGIHGMNALDPLGLLPGQLPFYSVKGGELTQKDGLQFRFTSGATLTTSEFPDNNATVCNMLMPRRNTVFLVLANDSDMTEITFGYRTTLHDDWCEKKLEILPHSPATAYYCNLSDTSGCEGRMRQFYLRCGEGSGTLQLVRYTFEEEKAIEQLAGKVESCVARDGKITVSGVLKNFAVGDELALYQTNLSDGDDLPDGKELILTQPATEAFTLENIDFRAHGISRLSAQFLLFLRSADGTAVKVDERFVIENLADFTENKYAFDLPDYTVSVLDFGAKGDAVHNDTDAIQAAIDAVAAAGGGKVVVPGDDSFYGKRYIVTNLLMRSFVELHFEKGSVLWQSQLPTEYCYRPFYGHDGEIDGINWTHSLHICNLPTIQVHNAEHVKITGKGKIRSMDTGSEEGVDMPGYSCGCPDRIHQLPIGFFNVRHANLEGFELVRTNNYHLDLTYSTDVSVMGVKIYQVKCVSGDGIGLGGAHNILISGVQFQSNDDGVTITSHYHDPRGILWWYSTHDGHCGPYNVRIEHCYLNSSGGKAIAFIPWGTTQTYAEYAESHDIEVYDCHLTCVNPVGAWADNPYAGKMPFDNTDLDDYSAVRSVRILGNRYQGNCAIYPLQITDFVTDCGLHSAEQFLNGDFTAGGFANWCSEGSVKIAQLKNRHEYGEIINGKLYQGIYLQKGTHTLVAGVDAPAGAMLFALETEREGAETLSLTVTGEGEFALTVTVEKAGMWYLGVQAAAQTAVYSCRVDSVVDRDAIREAAKAEYRAQLEKDFIWDQTNCVGYNETDGKLFLTGDAALGTVKLLSTQKEMADVEIGFTIQVDGWHEEQGDYGYGFVLRKAENGSCIVMKFFAKEKHLRVQTVAADGSVTTLYDRENFFFTSLDYHSFQVRLEGEALTFWVDNGKYATVHGLPSGTGKAAFMMQDMKYRMRGIEVQQL